ncbi:hypothetical protein QQS21_008606 [Conoideocrella luteorostrata]|uniref:Uncharacterized protein n=1 Tax=Conoideocrella luteorostrata TaxID=1105319 RepID=A0AAJ0FWF0_9HYPO|nr:hypothetical protein QQS21_008606 [Conoideocrella luteorostrata]
MPHRWNRDPEHHGDIQDFQSPKPLQRTDTAHSRYVQMLLDVDEIPLLHSILASFFVWLLLAGFLVFPGTFTTIQKSIENKHPQEWTDQTTDKILKSVKNVQLLVVAAVACGISVIGMVVLALRHLDNYVWMLNKMIMPGIANCLAGLISTLVGVYSQQHGVWSPTAKVTAIVEGACLGIAGTLFVFFERFLLRKIRDNHGAHYGDWSSKEDVTKMKNTKTASEL